MGRRSSCEDEIVTGQVLAARLGLTATRVSKLAGDGVMVRAARGKYRAWASAKSYCESLRKAASGRESATAQARRRLIEAQALRAEKLYQKECGHLVEAGRAEREMGETLKQLFREIVLFPWRLANAAPQVDRYVALELENGLRRLLSNVVAGRAAAEDGDGTQFPEPWLEGRLEEERLYREAKGLPVIRWPKGGQWPKPEEESADAHARTE
jgi:hypothetical protein